MALEKTFVMLKPDAVARGLCGRIIARFEEKGLKIVAIKMFRFSADKCRLHYAHLADKPFFPRIEEFICSSPIVAMIIEGKDAVEVVHNMCGPTDSSKALPGTIRGDFGMSKQSNLIHSSDSAENAKAEIARFFKPEEENEYTRSIDLVMYAKDEI